MTEYEPIDHAALSERYPAWNIWRSDTGRWWATAGRLSAAERSADMSATVQADTAGELHLALADQERRRALAAADAWRTGDLR